MSNNVTRTSDDVEQSASGLGQKIGQAGNINRRLQDLINRRAEVSGNSRVRMPDNEKGDRLAPSQENEPVENAGSPLENEENHAHAGKGDSLSPNSPNGIGSQSKKGYGNSIEAPKEENFSGNENGAGKASESPRSDTGVSANSGAPAGTNAGEALSTGSEAGTGGTIAVGDATGSVAAGGEAAASGAAVSSPIGLIIIAVCIAVIIMFILICGAIIQVLGDPMIEKQYDEGYEIKQEYGTGE